jgi:glycerophosphoryl diester phosphodiesterase
MAAFAAAIPLGVDAIELDVHLSRDRQVIVMHDGKFGRTSNGTGNIADHTLEEIKKLDAGSWKGSQFTGERVPTLSEVFERIPINVMCEIKDTGEDIVRETATVVKAAEAEQRTIIASFDDETLEYARHHLPNCERLVLGRPALDRLDHAQIAAPHFGDAEEGFVRSVQSSGRAVWLWTVDDDEDIARVMALGVDGIISNYPDRTLRALQARTSTRATA